MLLDLPNELTLLVLRSLPPRSLEPLGRLCCTCRALRRMASTSALWRTLCHGIFTEQELAAAYPSGAPQWRDACRQLLFERARSRRWKARQRLEEAKGRRAAGAVEKSPPAEALANSPSSQRKMKLGAASRLGQPQPISSSAPAGLAVQTDLALLAASLTLTLTLTLTLP